MGTEPEVITFESIKRSFEGRNISITHKDNSNLKDRTGRCISVTENKGAIEFRLKGHNCYAVIPDELTSKTVVTGRMHIIEGTRTVRLA